MGAGKTTVGKIIAKQLGFSFLDTDDEIVKRTGADIGWIFELEGEEGFREREEEVLSDIAKYKSHVFATGGGMVESAKNRAILASQGFVIYLSAPVETQVARVTHDSHRPLLDGLKTREDLHSRLDEIQKRREPWYREIADVTIEISSSSKDSKAVAKEVLDRLPLLI